MQSLHIIYASTSGHTEHVVNALTGFLSSRTPDIKIERQRAELATAEDLQRGDLLILASGTWNFGGIEGHLNEHMHRLLFEKAGKIALGGKPVALISLGDDRYRFTTRCTERFMQFIKESGARLVHQPLTIVNEPYGQEERIRKWAGKLLEIMARERPVNVH